MNVNRLPVLLILLTLCTIGAYAQTENSLNTNYSELEKLHANWREFETPPLRDGAPDYTAATFEKR